MLIILAMTGAFWRYPIGQGPLDQSGSGFGHATTRARAMLQLGIYEFQYVLQYIVINQLFGNHQLILVFLFLFGKTCKTPHIKKSYFVMSHEYLPILYCLALFCILFSVAVFWS